MSFTTIDPDEIIEPRAYTPPADGVSAAIGSSAFIASHRFDGLRLDLPGFRGPGLAVSRYYWMASPKVVVDFKRDIRSGDPEIGVKRAYCEQHGIRYVLAVDPFDEDAVRGISAGSEATGARPVTAPRRRGRPKKQP